MKKKIYPFVLLGLGWTFFRFNITSVSLKAYAAQVANQILHEVCHVFRHDVPGAHFGRIILHDVGQDLASRTQSFATQSFGSAPQERPDPTEETAENIAHSTPSL